MTPLLAAELSAIATIMFAGMNAYQGMASHEEAAERAERFGAVVHETQMQGRLKFLRFFFYGIMPVAYGALLLQAGIDQNFAAAILIKMGVSAGVSLSLERTVLNGKSYPVKGHFILRADSWINVGCAIGIAYLLVEAGRG